MNEPSVVQRRIDMAAENERIRIANLARIHILKSAGMTTAAVAQEMRLPESSILSLLKEKPSE